MNARNLAACELRDNANLLIELALRAAKGWDKGAWCDNVRIVDRNRSNTIAAMKRAIESETERLAKLAM